MSRSLVFRRQAREEFLAGVSGMNVNAPDWAELSW